MRASVRSELLFEEFTGHPDGSVLLCYPRDDREDSPAGIVKEVRSD
ncbi:bacteriocin immunity protein [Vagococcus sp. WN89Y]